MQPDTLIDRSRLSEVLLVIEMEGGWYGRRSDIRYTHAMIPL